MTKKIFTTIIIIPILILIITFGCSKKDEPINQKPFCSITSPTEGQEFVFQDSIIISVNATDNDGTIEEIIFMADNEILDFSSTFPYTYIWDISEVSAGIHSIRASCLDNNGGSNFDEVTIKIIQTEGAPIASFSFYPAAYGPAPLWVHFEDESTNTPTSWLWDFGDGSTSTLQSPGHTFSTVGSFDISLTATNSSGTDTEIRINYITTHGGGNIGSFTDSRDGQVYDSIHIGTQTWMTTNLNYNTSASSWNYDNDIANAEIYGRLYSWNDAMNSCPTGWHLPGDGEWKTLEKQLGMSQSEADLTGWRGTTEGGELKESGTEHWIFPNIGASNTSHLTVLPGGRFFNNNFGDLNSEAYFWTSSENGSSNAVYRRISYNNSQIGRSDAGNKIYGYSVRCVKNTNL